MIKLLGFEVSPGNAAVVTNVPVAADLGRVRTRSHINIRDVDTVQGKAGGIPRVDVTAQVARLPAERPSAIKAEGCGDGG